MQRISIVAYLIIDHKDLPPKQAPKANAHTSGWSGSPNSLFSESEIAILTIIVVRGILSTKAEAIADT